MRKRKPAAVAAQRGSIADQFGDAPYAEQHGTSDVMMTRCLELLRDGGTMHIVVP